MDAEEPQQGIQAGDHRAGGERIVQRSEVQRDVELRHAGNAERGGQRHQDHAGRQQAGHHHVQRVTHVFADQSVGCQPCPGAPVQPRHQGHSQQGGHDGDEKHQRGCRLGIRRHQAASHHHERQAQERGGQMGQAIPEGQHVADGRAGQDGHDARQLVVHAGQQFDDAGGHAELAGDDGQDEEQGGDQQARQGPEQALADGAQRAGACQRGQPIFRVARQDRFRHGGLPKVPSRRTSARSRVCKNILLHPSRCFPGLAIDRAPNPRDSPLSRNAKRAQGGNTGSMERYTIKRLHTRFAG